MCRTTVKPALEVADIIKKYGDAYRATGKVPAHHLRTLSAIERCRTALGGHLNVCTDCGSSKISKKTQKIPSGGLTNAQIAVFFPYEHGGPHGGKSGVEAVEYCAAPRVGSAQAAHLCY